MMLWKLKKGQRFEIRGESLMGVLIATGRRDGAYVQVKAEDPKIHKKLCARYDDKSDFFCLHASLQVKLVEE